MKLGNNTAAISLEAADTAPSTSFGPEFEVMVTAAVGVVDDHVAVSGLTAD